MQDHKLAIYRLTALWAFLECGLGGILHAAKLPVTGFVIGAFAIVILSLIAAIIKRAGFSMREHLIPAVMIVVLVKAMVTPHAGIGAYLAVGFQGFVAFLLFSTALPLRLAAIILGVFSMVESALQKVLVLSALYGNSIWDAVDGLASWVTSKFGLLELSLTSFELVGTYTLVYAIWGMIVGWGSAILAYQVIDEKDVAVYQIDIMKSEESKDKKKRNRWKLWIFVAILLAICSYFIITDSPNSIVYLLARVLLVLFLVFKVIGPIATKILHRFLQGKQTKYKDRLAEVLDLLPYMRQIITRAWKDTAELRGFERLWNFIKLTLLITLYHNPITEENKAET